MNPPNVYEVTMPNNHSTRRMTAIVTNIGKLFYLFFVELCRCLGSRNGLAHCEQAHDAPRDEKVDDHRKESGPFKDLARDNSWLEHRNEGLGERPAYRID